MWVTATGRQKELRGLGAVRVGRGQHCGQMSGGRNPAAEGAVEHSRKSLPNKSGTERPKREMNMSQ